MNANLTATIADLATKTTRKLTADDIYNSHRDITLDVAHDILDAYAGTFPFMLNMREWRDAGCTLTDQQIAGILNTAIADYRHAQKSAPAAPTTTTNARTYDHSKQVVADGWYTIVGPQGGHRTLRLQTVEEKSDGVKQWLAYLSGADNVGDYTTIGFVHGNEVTLFAKHTGKFADIVAAARFLVKNAANVGEYGKQYALRSGKCYVCNRRLTTPESIANGIGPVCASK